MTISHAPWRAVTAMFLLAGALYGIWASRIPTVAQQHHLSPGSLGILLLLLAFGAICAFPIAGRGADKIGAAKITLHLAIASCIGLILVSLAPNIIALSIALFAFGAVIGAMDVTMNVWAGEVEDHMKRPVMSSFHAMFSLGAGIGAGSGFLAITYNLDLTAHFILASVLSGLFLIPAANIPWESKIQETQPKNTLIAIPKGKLLIVGIAAFCATLGEGGITDWSAIYLVEVTLSTHAEATLGYIVFSIAMVIMRLLGNSFTQYAGPVMAMRFAGATTLLGVVCAVLLNSYELTLLGFALMGIGYAVVMPLAFSRAADDKDTTPGAAIAAVSTLGYGGILMGPPLIGFVSEVTSLKAAFSILGILACLMILCSNAFTPTEK